MPGDLAGDLRTPVLWSSIEAELRSRMTPSPRPQRRIKPALAGLASAVALMIGVSLVAFEQSPAPTPSTRAPGYESRIPADDLTIFAVDDPRLLPAANVR